MATSVARIRGALRQEGVGRGRAALDRLFAHWFARLVYNQIWEDPEVDLAALAIDPTCRVVAIASAGCNILNYLAADPAEIVAVDLNSAHIALTRLKLAAMRHLPDYDAFHRFFGEASDGANLELYDRYLRWRLDAETRRFWEKRTLLGRRRIEFFASGLYHKALLGRFIGLLHGLARLLGHRPSRLLAARTIEEQHAIFAAEIEPLFRTWLVRRLSRQPTLLYSLGIPPSQFAALREAACDGDLASLYHERVRKLACGFALSENYFAWQAFGRRYGATAGAPLPPYLQGDNYAAIRARLDRVTTKTMSMTDFLAGEAAASCDRFVLLDSVDWMDEGSLRALWEQIGRTARPGARVIFRTAGLHSPLERLLPPDALRGWRYHEAESNALLERDRSAIYGGFHLYSHG